MKITPLNNTLSKKSSSESTTLCAACCCCILAPIGSYIAEKIINKKYPERGSVWKHFFANIFILLITCVFLFVVAYINVFKYVLSGTSTIVYMRWGVIDLIVFIFMYILFYLYSFSWFNRELGNGARIKIVFWESLLTAVLVGALFALSLETMY